MRVNVYAEELPEQGAVEIISKQIEGAKFTGLRIPLYLPVTLQDGTQARGKFMHHPGDDDSSAITIWGKRDLRALLREALTKLDEHYAVAPVTTEFKAEERENATSRHQVLTCVYCGHQYPDGTPATKHQLLTDHIKECAEHPLRTAEQKIAKLRGALAGFIGADTREELTAMEATIRTTPAPESDKAVAINAIEALLDCLSDSD